MAEKETDRDLKDSLDRLIGVLEKGSWAGNGERRSFTARVFYLDFLGGLARGFGMAVGFTLVAAAIVRVLRHLMSVPVLGAVIAQMIDIVYLHRGVP